MSDVSTTIRTQIRIIWKFVLFFQDSLALIYFNCSILLFHLNEQLQMIKFFIRRILCFNLESSAIVVFAKCGSYYWICSSNVQIIGVPHKIFRVRKIAVWNGVVRFSCICSFISNQKKIFFWYFKINYFWICLWCNFDSIQSFFFLHFSISCLTKITELHSNLN